jgi:cytochrome c553
VLKHYKNGRRKNPIMQGQVANLSQKDIYDLAAYYASQKGLTIKY